MVERITKTYKTNIVEPPKRTQFASGKSMPTWYADAFKLPKEERAKLRSKTHDPANPKHTPGSVMPMENWSG